MVLSFHPCFVADENRICAGREAIAADQKAIARASAVILPQGCPRSLYRMARRHCAAVFPNYDARFEYDGKLGQIRLFEKIGINHPKSMVFERVTDTEPLETDLLGGLGFGFPMVLKFDWGGEGETVRMLNDRNELEAGLEAAAAFEATGQRGFLLQEYIESGGRVLRAAIIGSRVITYWRYDPTGHENRINLRRGGKIDHAAALDLQHQGAAALKQFCAQTGINLAGFDFLFDKHHRSADPYFLEINYFFGRRGLGGSETYYRILNAEINAWLSQKGLPTIHQSN